MDYRSLHMVGGQSAYHSIYTMDSIGASTWWEGSLITIQFILWILEAFTWWEISDFIITFQPIYELFWNLHMVGDQSDYRSVYTMDYRSLHMVGDQSDSIITIQSILWTLKPPHGGRSVWLPFSLYYELYGSLHTAGDQSGYHSVNTMNSTGVSTQLEISLVTIQSILWTLQESPHSWRSVWLPFSLYYGLYRSLHTAGDQSDYHSVNTMNSTGVSTQLEISLITIQSILWTLQESLHTAGDQSGYHSVYTMNSTGVSTQLEISLVTIQSILWTL